MSSATPGARHVRRIGHIDCPGGGQVWVDGSVLYVGHMRAPSGTSLWDIADPARPKPLASIDLPEGWHSHKVRASDGIMVVNHEWQGGDPAFGGGLAIYDVADPTRPRPLGKWTTAGKGVHRYDFDGRYAYISPTVEGYIGNIVMILDLARPGAPEEVGRWWLPGQWQAGGEDYPWNDYVPPRCHHPLRVGDRLHVSYWHHGFVILDIADMSRPRAIAERNTTSSFPHPTHTCLRLPQPLRGREIMIAADEDVAKLYPAAPAFAWVYDVTDERNPTSIATFRVDSDGRPQPPMTGCHQPSERLAGGSVVPFAWFARGLRLVDFADPFLPREVGFYQAEPPPGCERASSNDVTIDRRGLLFLVDRQRGVDILESDVL